MSESRPEGYRMVERIWEDLLDEIEEVLPADFTPRTGRLPEEKEPDRVKPTNRPESPPPHQARERIWTQLWHMRSKLLARLAKLRQGKGDWLRAELKKLLDDAQGLQSDDGADEPVGADDLTSGVITFAGGIKLASSPGVLRRNR